jgi:phosphoribosylanthranilate isomerase
VTLMVKICGLRDADDVAAAVAAGADAVGFVFADSVRRVEPAEAADAVRQLPADVRRVAVMRHPGNDEWQRVLERFRPDVLQTDVEDFAALDVPVDVVRWPVFREGGAAAPRAGDTFLYEGAVSGSGRTVDWSRAEATARGGNMILAGGLDPENVGAAIRAVRPWGVDVSSGVESAPGEKSAALMQAFLRAARAAEKDL